MTAQTVDLPAVRTRRTTRAAATGVAALAALVVWVVAGPVAGVDFSVTRSGTTTEVGPAEVIGFTIGAALLGWALLAVLERFTARPRRIWTITAVVVLLVSLAMPFNSGEIDTAAKWVLLALHLVVGGTVIPLFARTSR